MRLGHVPVLDALRGIAILLVLLVHVPQFLPEGTLDASGGVLGVDLFFVLSGFLITSLLLTEWSDRESISLRLFYRRRALRLLPALVVMLAVVSTVLAVRGELVDEWPWVLFSLGYVVNIASIAEGEIGSQSLEHMWSLSQEEQFYILWPVVLLLMLRRRARPQTIVTVLVTIAVLLVAWRAFLGLALASPGYLLYAPETRSVGLVLGCIAGVLFSGGLVRRVPLNLATAMLVPAVLAVALLTLDSRVDAVVLVPVFCVAATVVLLACVLHPGWWLARMVDRAWLRGLGKISYALYLWHLPILVAFGWAVGLPLAILVAIASYYVVERPFLRRRYRPGDYTATGSGRTPPSSPVISAGARRPAGAPEVTAHRLG